MREVEGKGEAGVVREGDNGGDVLVEPGAKSRLSGRWGRKQNAMVVKRSKPRTRDVGLSAPLFPLPDLGQVA